MSDALPADSDKRPDDCSCKPGDGLPCFECFQEGFAAPVVEREGDTEQ
jgi:hypothetical protein